MAQDSPEVSVVIITVGRPCLYELLGLLAAQEADFPYEIVVIANGPVDEAKIDTGLVRLYHEDPGRGIPHYRNLGMELSRGHIIAYIDDDETPVDGEWLQNITRPILLGEERVTVAQTYIPQGQGFFADLVSMLGYPGGASLGWRNVYNVDEDNHTDKLPSGNCAIEKSLLEEIGGFHDDLALGASDLLLGEDILERGVKMRFVDEASVTHEARSDLVGFARWQINRGRSVYTLQKIRPIRQLNRAHVGGRLKRTWVILKATFPTAQFIPMLGVLFLEYFLHGVGFILELHVNRKAVKSGARDEDRQQSSRVIF